MTHKRHSVAIWAVLYLRDNLKFGGKANPSQQQAQFYSRVAAGQYGQLLLANYRRNSRHCCVLLWSAIAPGGSLPMEESLEAAKRQAHCQHQVIQGENGLDHRR